jgi:hypothetical protein
MYTITLGHIRSVKYSQKVPTTSQTYHESRACAHARRFRSSTPITRSASPGCYLLYFGLTKTTSGMTSQHIPPPLCWRRSDTHRETSGQSTAAPMPTLIIARHSVQSGAVIFHARLILGSGAVWGLVLQVGGGQSASLRMRRGVRFILRAFLFLLLTTISSIPERWLLAQG